VVDLLLTVPIVLENGVKKVQFLWQGFMVTEETGLVDQGGEYGLFLGRVMV
jgi:hypothetical protein